jgi:hypothetical protein
LEAKKLQIAKAILSKKSNPGGITIPDFKLYYRTIAIKQHGISTKTDMKTSGTESPDKNPHSYTHLIFDKVAQNL